MAKFKAKAMVDGQEKEVELDDTVYIPVEQAQTRLNDTVRKRLARQAASIREELMADLKAEEGFGAEVLRKLGIDPSKLKGDGKTLTDSDVARLQAELRKAEVEPLKAELQKTTDRLTKTQRRQLVADLTSEMIAAGVKKSVAPKLAALEAEKFGYDEESDSWAVKDGDGFAYAVNATKDRPYKGPSDYAQDFVADKENGEWVDRATQKGPDVKGKDGESRRTSTGAVASRKDFKTDQEKADWIGENGFAKYMELPAGE